MECSSSWSYCVLLCTSWTPQAATVSGRKERTEEKCYRLRLACALLTLLFWFLPWMLINFPSQHFFMLYWNTGNSCRLLGVDICSVSGLLHSDCCSY
uniref:G_PROTEIN_RECEP_F1_2 domain-containing protein n=1 Tax=Macrostomum lignano TaxID=282301 RepID=A0A1I8F6P1_9PLAT